MICIPLHFSAHAVIRCFMMRKVMKCKCRSAIFVSSIMPAVSCRPLLVLPLRRRLWLGGCWSTRRWANPTCPTACCWCWASWPPSWFAPGPSPSPGGSTTALAPVCVEPSWPWPSTRYCVCAAFGRRAWERYGIEIGRVRSFGLINWTFRKVRSRYPRVLIGEEMKSEGKYLKKVMSAYI